MLSLIHPLRRFRCEAIGCGWQGNLPITSSSVPATLWHEASDRNRPR
jgi:hypothetical protein